MLMSDTETLYNIMMYENGVCAFLLEKEELKQFQGAKNLRGRITIRESTTYKDYSYFYEVLELPKVTSQISAKNQGCVVLKLSRDTDQPDIKHCHSVFTRAQIKNMNWIL